MVAFVYSQVRAVLSSHVSCRGTISDREDDYIFHFDLMKGMPSKRYQTQSIIPQSALLPYARFVEAFEAAYRLQESCLKICNPCLSSTYVIFEGTCCLWVRNRPNSNLIDCFYEDSKKSFLVDIVMMLQRVVFFCLPGTSMLWWYTVYEVIYLRIVPEYTRRAGSGTGKAKVASYTKTPKRVWTSNLRVLSTRSLLPSSLDVIHALYSSVWSIDYRREDVSFQVSASCVTFSIPDSLSSSETGVHAGIRRWKSTYLIEFDVREPLVVYHKL